MDFNRMATGWTASDTHKLRRFVPLQNLFYLRQLFDPAENAANHLFGIPLRSGQARTPKLR